jgi:hypothetical protein
MYSIDGDIEFKVKGTGVAISKILPNDNDPRITGDFDYYMSGEKNENGNYELSFMIRFKPNSKADRDSLFANLKALEELFSHCEDDSWIGYHTCGNYEEPPVSCQTLELYREYKDGTVTHTVNGEPV